MVLHRVFFHPNSVFKAALSMSKVLPRLSHHGIRRNRSLLSGDVPVEHQNGNDLVDFAEFELLLQKNNAVPQEDRDSDLTYNPFHRLMSPNPGGKNRIVGPGHDGHA